MTHLIDLFAGLVLVSEEKTIFVVFSSVVLLL